jgi:NACHT domain
LNYNKALRERQVGTGSWFIEDERYADWKTTPNSFIWLYGILGCGKTILCSTIIEDVFHHCHHKPAMVVIYFFFDFNDGEKQQHEKMIRSLTSQLFLRYTNTPRALMTLFHSCMDGEQQPTSDALLATLQQMICGFDEIFIILDALDECAERKELLETIGNITKQGIGKLHILATSRREKEIEESLNYLVDNPVKFCIQTALVNGDIQAYIQTRLRSDQNLKRWKNKPEVQQEIMAKLMDKADGM